MPRNPFSRHAAVIGVALSTVAGLAASARAQRTPDPYNIVGEYNLGYEDFMYAVYPNGAGIVPNQALLQSRAGYSRANQFQSYLDDLTGSSGRRSDLFGGGLGRGGPSSPYYLAHRQFDDVFRRIYTPNAASDTAYYQDQEARTQKYLQYLRERDPKKRAQLFREYKQMNLRAARDFSSAAMTRATARGTSAGRSGASSPPASGSSSGETTGAESPPASIRLTPPGARPRRPSSVLSPSGRMRGAAGVAPSRLSETPEDILDRATRSAITAPSGAAGRPAPALTPYPAPAPAPR